MGMADRVLTLTTIGTPHRGSPCADLGVRALGGTRALWDMLRVPYQAYIDLTTTACRKFNETTPDSPALRYFSVAGRIDEAWRSLRWLARRNDRRPGPRGRTTAWCRVASANLGRGPRRRARRSFEPDQLAESSGDAVAACGWTAPCCTGNWSAGWRSRILERRLNRQDAKAAKNTQPLYSWRPWRLGGSIALQCRRVCRVLLLTVSHGGSWHGVFPAAVTHFHADYSLDPRRDHAAPRRDDPRRRPRHDHARHGRRKLLARLRGEAGGSEAHGFAHRRPHPVLSGVARMHDEAGVPGSRPTPRRSAWTV